VGLSEAHKRNRRFFLFDPCGGKTSLFCLHLQSITRPSSM